MLDLASLSRGPAGSDPDVERLGSRALPGIRRQPRRAPDPARRGFPRPGHPRAVDAGGTALRSCWRQAGRFSLYSCNVSGATPPETPGPRWLPRARSRPKQIGLLQATSHRPRQQVTFALSPFAQHSSDLHSTSGSDITRGSTVLDDSEKPEVQQQGTSGDHAALLTFINRLRLRVRCGARHPPRQYWSSEFALQRTTTRRWPP